VISGAGHLQCVECYLQNISGFGQIIQGTYPEVGKYTSGLGQVVSGAGQGISGLGQAISGALDQVQVSTLDQGVAGLGQVVSGAGHLFPGVHKEFQVSGREFRCY
jgi:hypothetical protein